MANKIIDKINEVNEAGGTTVSFEFFPAKVSRRHSSRAQELAVKMSCHFPHHATACLSQTVAGKDNLLRRIEDMTQSLAPTFVTLTWRSAFKVRQQCCCQSAWLVAFFVHASLPFGCAGREVVAVHRGDSAEEVRC